MRDQPDQSSRSDATVERLARAARAAQQLCDVLWESLQEELRDPQAERVKGLTERLVEVSSTVALLASAPTGANAAESNSDVRADVHTDSRPDALGPSGATGARPATGSSPRADALDARPASEAPANAVSAAPSAERRKPPAPSRPQTPPSVALQSIPTSVGEYTFTKLVDEQEQEQEQEGEAQPLASVQPIQPEIEIRDVRREEGPSAWVSSVGRLLARHAEDGLPFAVLLVEIVDVAHLERSETPHDLHGLVARVESALGSGMRATDRLSRETLGRYWLVAPETNGTGARMLAERLARLVRTSATHRNVPMEVAIGIAVCPDDGIEAPALAARADLGVYSARATGRSIAHTDPPAAS
ncbi:MAG TPA: diguanylate cyclase [Solirubrobacteraceae bacterium]|nr:diguanylate cyclase [Solirubrobacteraceae bacterium]